MTAGGNEPQDGRSRRQSKDETKRDLLQTGRQLLIKQGVPGRINIKLTDVLKEKGLTTGAAYHIWGSQNEFQEDLAEFIAAEFEWASIDVLPDPSLDLNEAGSEDRVRALGEAYLNGFRSREEYFIVLQLWGIQNPPEAVSDAIREGYDLVHQGLVALIEANHERSGDRRWKEGFGPDDAATLVSAICEGLALRGRFDDGRLTNEKGQGVFGEALIALLEHFTEPIDGSD